MTDDTGPQKVGFREESMEERKSTVSKSSSFSQQSIAHIGRPIAQVSRIPDPVWLHVYLHNVAAYEYYQRQVKNLYT